MKEFYANINPDCARAGQFMEALGTLRVPIQTFIPEFSDLAGLDGLHAVYRLDRTAISDAQYDKLVRCVAKKFGADESIVREHLDAVGLAILATDCVIEIRDAQRCVVS